MNPPLPPEAAYWNATADLYQSETRISVDNFHYGPLLPGDNELNLLPEKLKATECLEVGCGAGQNSIVLARKGARCTALDIADRQLAIGGRLAATCGVDIDFRCGDMDNLGDAELGQFDLIHSTYALPFSRRPQQVIASISGLLRPGGMFLLTTSHPVYAGEWIDTEEGEETGVFLQNYFNPPPDIRSGDMDHHGSSSHSVPPSQVWSWLTNASFSVDRFLEPSPLPIPNMSEEEIRDRIPYESDDWRGLYPILNTVPPVVIFRARLS